MKNIHKGKNSNNEWSPWKLFHYHRCCQLCNLTSAEEVSTINGLVILDTFVYQLLLDEKYTKLESDNKTSGHERHYNMTQALSDL